MCERNDKWYGSKWIRPAKRLAIYIRDGFTCAYCRRDLRDAPPAEITLDHIDPVKATGKPNNAATNLLTCCRACNSSKGCKEAGEFIACMYPNLTAELWKDKYLKMAARPLNMALAKELRAGK